MKKTLLSTAVRSALGVTAVVGFMPSMVIAQEQGTTSDKKVVEEVLVTGSRLKTSGFDGTSPVTITSSEQIKLSGFTRIEDLLNNLPQVEAAETGFLANGATGTATLDLRGMGAQRTLVLVNGRRLQPGGVYSQSPDVNQIPSALVERVEVLTGGASATYGADAVAGVVNFVMKDDFEGVEINVGAAGYQHNNNNKWIQNLMDESGFEYPSGNTGIDGKSYNFDFTVGGSFDDGRGHATAYATWRKNDELRQGARDYSSCALSLDGRSCGGSGNAIVPNFYIEALDADGAMPFADYEYWTLDPNGDGFIPSVGNVYNYAPVNHFLRPDERYTFGAFVNFEVNSHVKPYFETSFMNDKTVAQIAESGTFFNQQYNIDVDSPLLSATQQQQIRDRFGLTNDDQFGTYVGKRNVEGGPRASIIEHNAFRIVIGSEGEINSSWDYNASFQYGNTSSSAAYVNDFFGPRIATALSANEEDCAATAGCIPYEVFTFEGISNEAASALTGTAILNGTTTETIFNAYISGDTGLSFPHASSSIAVVAGIEKREQTFERLSDEVFAQGLLLGQGGPTPSLSGQYSVEELFAEARLPVLEGVTGAEELSFDLAVRYSDYSSGGSEPTYKLGVIYSPIEMTKIRAGYNRAVRSPNIAELFLDQSLGLWQGSDPCAGSDPVYSQAECARTGVTGAQYGNIVASPASQYNEVAGGNTELTPEIADTFTFGVVVNPLDNLTFSIDYWDIDIKDVIDSIGSELIIDQCASAGELCENITRSAAGSLWLGTEGFVTNPQRNLGELNWEGVDFAATHELDLFGGSLVSRFIGTRMLTKQTSPLLSAPTTTYDCVGKVDGNCFAQPEWRHSLEMTYDSNSFWSVSAKWRYYGEVSHYGEDDTTANSNLTAQSYFDLKGGFTVTDNLGLLVGVNNIFDQEPPSVGSGLSTNANTVAGYYDTLGRYVHASATYSFD